MKFLTPMELRSVNFKKINQLYESKEIGFVGFNFDTFHTVSPRWNAGFHFVERAAPATWPTFAHGRNCRRTLRRAASASRAGPAGSSAVSKAWWPPHQQEWRHIRGRFRALRSGGQVVGTSRADAFVDLNAHQFQQYEDILFGARHETLRVGALDAEDVRAPAC